MPPKKGFGAKLKGVGKRIVQEAKKVPGTIYREGIKPYAQHMADKFTEVGPSPGSPPISEQPQTPYRKGDVVKSGSVSPGVPTGLKRRKNPPGQKAKIRPAKSVPPKPIAEQIAPMSRPEPKDYGRAGGRTSSYKVGTGKNSAVARLAEADKKRKARETRPLLRRGTPQEKAIRDATKTTTAKPLVDQTRTTPKGGRTKGQARGSVSGYRTPKVTATATAPKEEPKTPTPTPKKPTDATYPRRKQKAGTEAARKKKPGKRKFSPKRTAETLDKAAEKRREDIAKVGRIDTSATDMARILTEQEVGREAERANAALKVGRKPQREKARYRLRTRGYKRSEGRSR